MFLVLPEPILLSSSTLLCAPKVESLLKCSQSTKNSHVITREVWTWWCLQFKKFTQEKKADFFGNMVLTDNSNLTEQTLLLEVNTHNPKQMKNMTVALRLSHHYLKY